MRTMMIVLWMIVTASLPVYAASVCLKKTCVEVEVVSTLEDLKRGLQGREGLGQNKGMLFVFDKDDFHRFWMKDMTFPIDMIWLDKNRSIVTIVPGCPPCIEDPCAVYESSRLAHYVLEVPAGFARDHQFKEGDVVKFKGIH
jgi:uncharacterized membrane protein (UPF0127 family)